MQPHRLMGQGLHHSQLNHPVRQQAQIPMFMSLRRWAAGQNDQVGFAPVVHLAVPVGLGPVLDRPVRPTPSSAKRRLIRYTVPSDTSKAWATLGAVQPSLVLEQDAGPGRNPGRTLPSPDHMLQPIALLRCQPDGKLLSDHATTSQQHNVYTHNTIPDGKPAPYS